MILELRCAVCRGCFNGDGKLGIAVANQNGNNATVLVNTGLQAVAGQSFNATVATFTDGNAYSTAADFTAVII